MSLIADALKRAQEQRQGGTGGSDAGARRLLTPSGPLRVPARKTRDVPRSLAVAGFSLAAAIVVFAVVVVLSPRAQFRASTAWAAEPEARDGGMSEGAAVLEVPSPSLDVPGGVADGAGESGNRAGGGVVGGVREGGEDDWLGAERAGTGDGGATGRRPTGAPLHAEDGDGYGMDGGDGDGRRSSFRMMLSGEPAVGDLVTRALGAQQAGDLAGAASLYRQALSSRPDDPQLHNNLGTVYRALGMPGQAYDAFQKALAADAGYAPAWNNLGLMLEGLGRLDEAVDAYREAIRLNAENGGARVNLANAYQSMGLTAEARRLLEAALREDPRLPEAHYALARLLEAAGDPVGARRHFTLFLNTGRGGFGALEAKVREHLEGVGR